MPTNEKVAEQLRRFELADWLYDGIGGKIIPWTKKHGGHSDDPAAQAFLLEADGTVVERATDNTCYTPSRFAEWLQAFADGYEREHPRTRIPFVMVEVRLEGETVACPSLAEAREANKPVLLYVSRKAQDDDDRAAKAQVTAARKFEKGALDSKKAAAAAAGWATLRIDLSRAADRRLAASLGVEKAPALIVFAPGAEEPEVLPSTLTGPELAHRLEKAKESED